MTTVSAMNHFEALVSSSDCNVVELSRRLAEGLSDPSDRPEEALPHGPSIIRILRTTQKVVFVDGAIILQSRHVAGGAPNQGFDGKLAVRDLGKLLLGGVSRSKL